MDRYFQVLVVSPSDLRASHQQVSSRGEGFFQRGKRARVIARGRGRGALIYKEEPRHFVYRRAKLKLRS